MKSLLQEGSSIVKAVEKAWSDAGMPSEFTVKILHEGEKNFLGFSKAPAIVSIIYDPQKQTKKIVERSNAPEQRKEKSSRGNPRRRGEGRNSDNRVGRKQEPAKSNQNNIQHGQQPVKKKTFPAWEDSWVGEITAWFNEVLKIMNITVPFQTSIDKQTLTVMFNEPVLRGLDEEHVLFASFSFLFIQFLKKQHRRRFSGYRLLVTSKRSDRKR
jgi:predicted RNA-binding protein Jag